MFKAFETQEELDEYFSGDKLVCLECGRSFVGLATHLRYCHGGIHPRDYKIKYGIPLKYGLEGELLRLKRRKIAKENHNKHPEWGASLYDPDRPKNKYFNSRFSKVSKSKYDTRCGEMALIAVKIYKNKTGEVKCRECSDLITVTLKAATVQKGNVLCKVCKKRAVKGAFKKWQKSNKDYFRLYERARRRNIKINKTIVSQLTDFDAIGFAVSMDMELLDFTSSCYAAFGVHLNNTKKD